MSTKKIEVEVTPHVADLLERAVSNYMEILGKLVTSLLKEKQMTAVGNVKKDIDALSSFIESTRPKSTDKKTEDKK